MVFSRCPSFPYPLNANVIIIHTMYADETIDFSEIGHASCFHFLGLYLLNSSCWFLGEACRVAIRGEMTVRLITLPVLTMGSAVRRSRRMWWRALHWGARKWVRGWVLLRAVEGRQ